MQNINCTGKVEVSVLVIAVAQPMLIGVYTDEKLIKSFQCQGETLQDLPNTFAQIMQEYQITKLYYSKGPGQAMAVKIAFVFLKAFALVRNLPFYACLGFEFNEFNPIKAFAKNYFVYDKGHFEVKNLEQVPNKAFHLPQVLDQNIFDEQVDLLFDKI